MPRIRFWHITLVLPAIAPLAHAQTRLPATVARIETAAIELQPPDRYRIAAVVVPDRSIRIIATEDGLVQAVSARVGQTVQDRQDLITLDRSEATAQLKIAQAQLKLAQAKLKAAAAGYEPVYQAELEAQQARVDLAQLALDRCSLKAPFAGLLLDVAVSPGEFVTKGTTLAELADLSVLSVRMPVDRSALQAGSTLPLDIEGAAANGTVDAILPLPESYLSLYELPVPWGLAVIRVTPAASTSNVAAGQRVENPFLPDAPLAILPDRALAGQPPGSVTVLRNEHVAIVPIRRMGTSGPGRVQVAGAFRPDDLVVVESTVPLAEGTFVRFNQVGTSTVETLPPDPSARGRVAELSGPGAADPPTAAPASRIAPIGQPRTNSTPAAPNARRPAQPAPTRPAAPGSVPF